MQVSRLLDFKLLEGAYEYSVWNERVKGFENEPEAGNRCGLCFRMRLEKTFSKSKELNLPYFTTTLTISPHKNSKLINTIGKEIGSGNFLERDFKKKAGFQAAGCFAREHNLYHQHYCGCRYSLR